MPIYIVKANFYYPYGAFLEGDKRMHMSKVIEAGTKFSSEANEYILELVRSGIIEEYREVVSETVLNGNGVGGNEKRELGSEKRELGSEKRELGSEKRDKEKK
jgi:hypothetical protein